MLAATATIPAGFTVPKKIRNPLRSVVNIVLLFAIVRDGRSGGYVGLIAMILCVAAILALIDFHRTRRAWKPVRKYRNEIMREFGDRIATPTKSQLAKSLEILANDPQWESKHGRKVLVEALTSTFPKLHRD